MTFESCRQILESLETGSSITIKQIIEFCSGTKIFQGTFGNILFNLTESAVGGFVLGLFIALGIIILFLTLLSVYIYLSLAWHTIAKKLKHPYPWLAWIPVASWAMILQLGGFYWTWIFLIFIPLFGWIALFVLLIISRWFIYEKRRYPGWFSLVVIIPKIGGVLHLIVIGFVAWNDKEIK